MYFSFAYAERNSERARDLDDAFTERGDAVGRTARHFRNIAVAAAFGCDVNLGAVDWRAVHSDAKGVQTVIPWFA